ncbi:DNA-dependent metalloprotease WSS1-like protein [Drosera capensis]
MPKPNENLENSPSKMEVSDLNKVWEIKALKKPGQDEAKRILERIAKQVQPIMRKRKWRGKVLSEFFPNNPSLLGLNVGGGVQVKLRLRRPNREWDFIPYNQVLDTMLHELCHNAHGPHNASFYQLWDELRKECEELISKGITGTAEGFDLPGRRLGGFSRQPPLPALRQTALAAAQKRQNLGALLPSGPQRLGGDKNIMSALSPIQAAAMAAERRIQDEIWCGSAANDTNHEESCSDFSEWIPENRPSTSGAQDQKDKPTSAVMSKRRDNESKQNLSPFSGSINFVDLSLDQDDSRIGKRVCRTEAGANSRSTGTHSIPSSLDSASRSSTDTMYNSEESGKWECETCTLLNPPMALVCEACNTLKPKDQSVKYKFWSCKFCTLENIVKLDKCSACGQWRYSTGAPISTRAPGVGT